MSRVYLVTRILFMRSGLDCPELATFWAPITKEVRQSDRYEQDCHTSEVCRDEYTCGNAGILERYFVHCEGCHAYYGKQSATEKPIPYSFPRHSAILLCRILLGSTNYYYTLFPRLTKSRNLPCTTGRNPVLHLAARCGIMSYDGT